MIIAASYFFFIIF